LIISWIASHGGNAEAVARYQVQLEVIDDTLRDLGLLDATGNPNVSAVKKELDVLFVNLPNITAASGSIFINAPGASPATYTPMVGTQLVSHAGANRYSE
jgi:hypothetical protein